MTATTINTATATASRHATPSRRRILQAVARAEWTKMRSVRSTMWTLLTTVGLAIGFGALIAATQINNWDNLDPAEKAMFDPTMFSLSGLFLAQLAIGVLGVLIVTSEYATGQIRATIAATPQRLTVLAAKSITYIAVVFLVGLVASFGAFALGQAIFSAEGLQASLTEPGVLRAVIGGALYLTAVGVLGIGLGTIIRRTAGAITSFVGLLMIVPLIASFLPASWNNRFAKYLPAKAGMAVFNVNPDPTSLSPWAGFFVLLLWAAATLAIGGLLLTRNDA